MTLLCAIHEKENQQSFIRQQTANFFNTIRMSINKQNPPHHTYKLFQCFPHSLAKEYNMYYFSSSVNVI